jgi:hypothetical protein
MNEIQDWFKTKDYNAGVKLYAGSPGCKSRILSTLQQGYSDRNFGLLISELRKLKNKVVVKVKKPTIEKLKLAPVETVKVQEAAERTQLIQKSSESYFQRVRFGDLPAELRPRFRVLKDLFYDMQDLKFALNDLPAKAEQDALKIQLAIEALDEQKETIWKEIDHWLLYKTLLPTKTEDDFSGLSVQHLFLKKASLGSSISKIKKRLEGWREDLTKQSNKQEAIKIEQQISRSERRLHTHEINLRKIEELL